MKICVVEDEGAVRTGIIQKLNRLQKDLEVFDVQFGRAALEKIRLIKPDLVITDILMPEIDGLELLRLIKQEMEKTEVVLLSGYNEFEYARRALRHGALNYLSKPVSLHDLRALVEEIETKSVERLDKELKHYWFQLSPQYPVPERIEYGAVHLWFDETIPKKLSFNERTKPECGPEEKTILSFVISPSVHAVVKSCSYRQSGCFFRGDQFVTAFAKAFELWRTARFFGDFSSVRKIPQQPDDGERARKAATLRFRLLEAMQEKNIVELERLLPEFFRFIELFPLKQLRKECALLMAALEEGQTMKHNIGFVDEDKLLYWSAWVEQHETWAHLRHMMQRFILGGVRALISLEESQPAGIVERARQIVLRHHNPQLTLESVAEQLNIHAVTLSRIFKQQTGENFIHYVIRQRMKMAERMLRESDKKISEIALEIGYSDQRHFSLLFKKTYGLSPMEYRKKHTGG